MYTSLAVHSFAWRGVASPTLLRRHRRHCHSVVIVVVGVVAFAPNSNLFYRDLLASIHIHSGMYAQQHQHGLGGLGGLGWGSENRAHMREREHASADGAS